MPNTRIKCAKALQTVLEDKVFFAALKNDFTAQELPLANMLILSALRYWVALNKILQTFLQKKIPHKHRAAQYLLLLAIAELLLMETASYAVINETVANVRQVSDKFLSGLANAVLRKIIADKTMWQKKMAELNILPHSFTEILAGYTPEQQAKIAAAVVQIPPLDLTVRNDAKLWAEKLNAEILPNATLRLHHTVKVKQLAGYDEGAWWVQDVAAALPVLALGDVNGLKIADLCAAPGGKTAQLAAAGAKVTAVDISAMRLEKLQQNMQRLGFDNVSVFAGDALDFLHNTTEQFDVLLLDAPCSATGTFRRHPEVLHIKNNADVTEQRELQEKLLHASAEKLKVGGILLYSVCSISRIEGEGQIQKFLKVQPNFSLIPIKTEDISRNGQWAENIITSEGYIRTLPYMYFAKGGMDSFFIAKMQRII
ncbi:MAG: RsmB/NOP family class I SAM-dependent RNA methyltransferase [Alphaproteobacteria bacterium]|nr:RsmB/NOP family class I SAM-dependent RNA methyltransferase [Alphaproteobacteria bacterium]